jgi:ribose transport system ATP-binding protein
MSAGPLLEMRGIEKSFPGVRALDGVSFSLFSGEVHAVVGENGAGKSTLMKILAGAQPADAGEIAIDGKTVTIDGPRAAERLGVGMIYQEFNLVPELDAIDNITLGIEPLQGILLDIGAAARESQAVLAELGLDLPLNVPVRRLSVAQQQMIEIAKALLRNARILVMDEPTAALTEREIDRLFALIAKLKASGVGIIYISHRLEELPRIADRITILRDGKAIETRPLAEMPADEMIRLMVGRKLDAHFPDLPPVAADAPIVLDVHDLTRPPRVTGVSLRVRSGEIVGIAGLVGAGRTEILRAIAGADIPERGTVSIAGKTVRITSPESAIEAGIAFITEDRKAQGLILGMTIRENVTLAHLGAFTDGGVFVDRRKETAATDRFINDLRIRTPGPEQIVRNLSGGTQQKVVLAKWLVGAARVFLFDEPTRGIDVGSKAEIYALMLELLRLGAGIVMVSSELPEVLGMSHRILVVRDGTIAAELDRAEATADRVIAIATGVAA